MLIYSRPTVPSNPSSGDPHAQAHPTNGGGGIGGKAIPKAINGRGLRHRRKGDLAALAADAVSGVTPYLPSVKQASHDFGVPQSVIRQILKQRYQRAQQVKQMGAADPVETTMAESIVSAWDAATDAARKMALKCIGPGNVWDRLTQV